MKKSLLFALIALCITLGLCFAQKKSAGAKPAYDVDLTRMSSTMVYAKVFDMLTQPENYEGKTVRMHGNFDVFEFKGNAVYPQDYPARFAEITVTGKFHQYEEDGLNYMLLVDSVIE